MSTLFQGGWLLHNAYCVDLCVEGTVPTNLAIDDRLIAEAQKLGRHRTKKETVNAALDEYVQRRKQEQIRSLFGTIDYDGSYDYKRARRKRA
jgi:Arc/MetJ family transcription regulator